MHQAETKSGDRWVPVHETPKPRPVASGQGLRDGQALPATSFGVSAVCYAIYSQLSPKDKD